MNLWTARRSPRRNVDDLEVSRDAQPEPTRVGQGRDCSGQDEHASTGSGRTVSVPCGPVHCSTASRPALERLRALFDDPADDPVVDGQRWPPGRRLARTYAPRAMAAANRHPLVTNVALAVAMAAASGHRLAQDGRLDWGTTLLTIGLSVPLVLRSHYPLAVFTALAAIAGVQWLSAEPMVADLSLLLVLITVSQHRPRRMTLTAAGILEVGVVLASLRWYLAGSWIRSLVLLSSMVVAAVLGGITLRTHRSHLAAAVERAEQAERERAERSRSAAAAERARIAREMHDVLAHSLAVIVSLADGAGAKLAHEPDRAATAVDHIAALARHSLHDTRRLLDVLRAGEPADDSVTHARPQPSIEDLDELLDPVRATGLHATMIRSGTVFEVPAGVALTVYRITQEALTNTLKHAAGAHTVHIDLAYQAHQLTIDIRDDGSVTGADTGRGIGHGLAGMRERVGVYHGTVEAGPHPGGGWQVRARLPLTPDTQR